MFGDIALNFLVDETGICRCHGQLSPIRSSSGDIARITDELQCIQQRIAIWKATKKGERPLRPRFGCCIRDYIHEPLTGSRLLDLKADLQRDLSSLFPEMTVKVLKVESWERNSVNIETMIGNYEIEIPANAEELAKLDSMLQRALSDLNM
jgi:phage baseplate assembly protein W